MAAGALGGRPTGREHGAGIEALARVLLYLESQGLAASYLNQPIEVDLLRRRLADMIGVRFPQILIRVGVPVSEARPTPRRPAEEVLLTAHDAHADPAAFQGF